MTTPKTKRDPAGTGGWTLLGLALVLGAGGLFLGRVAGVPRLPGAPPDWVEPVAHAAGVRCPSRGGAGHPGRAGLGAVAVALRVGAAAPPGGRRRGAGARGGLGGGVAGVLRSGDLAGRAAGGGRRRRGRSGGAVGGARAYRGGGGAGPARDRLRGRHRLRGPRPPGRGRLPPGPRPRTPPARR